MSKKILAGSALAAVLALGAIGGGSALASSSPGSDDVTRGSVQAPEREFENDAREDRSLEQRAKIGFADAEQAATAARQGEVTKVELEEEGGFVVYEVDIAGDNGVEHDITVDAGNGNILATETGRDDAQDRDDRYDDDRYDDDGHDDHDDRYDDRDDRYDD